MKKIMIFCAACLIGISAMAQQVDAVKFEQGSITDWYLLSTSPKVTFDADHNPVIAGKTYDLAEGAVKTTFGTAPAPLTYTREGLSDGKWGTICLAYAVADLDGVDATFYKLNYFDESANQLYVEKVGALAAGMPYMFEAKAESFTVSLVGEPADAGHDNGLYGTLEDVTKISEDGHAYAAIVNNQIQIVGPSYSITIGANRAYIDMNEVPCAYQQTSAPMRALGVSRGQATGLEMMHGTQCTMQDGKYVIKGQFVIVREGKMYNAQGI